MWLENLSETYPSYINQLRSYVYVCVKLKCLMILLQRILLKHVVIDWTDVFDVIC
jgi:hypothetical protein